jgi:hypothetical protein
MLAAALLVDCARVPLDDEPSRPATAPAAADVVYAGDHILTFEPGLPRARSLAVRGERIVCVDAGDECCALVGPDTRVVELGSRALLPGFIDAHGHVTMLASLVDRANLSAPPVGDVTTIASLQDALRAHLAAHPPAPGAWLAGYGYDDSLLAERRHPTRDDLDAVSRNVPIAILHVSGHLAVANGAALAAAGVSAETPDPPGGRFRRREASREPNGVAEEAALFELLGRSPLVQPITPEQLRRALAVYASFGFTTVQDGASAPESIAALERLAREGGAPLDVVYFPMLRDLAQPLPDAPLHEYRGGVAWGGVKLILDGSPQAKTAFLSEPYHVAPPGQPADYRGYPILAQQFVDDALARFVAARVPVIAHANGDAALDMLIGAVERALARAPDVDHRTVAIHAQTARDGQLDRMRAAGVIPSFFSAHPYYWGDWHRDSVLGPARAARISPARSALARGIPFTIHNDAPVVPPDAARLLWATVNRLTRSGRPLGAEQRIGTEDALRALTANAARQYFEEAKKGTLAVGKQADLVVLSEDPLAMAPEKLLELKVIETVSRGRAVFPEASDPASGTMEE